MTRLTKARKAEIRAEVRRLAIPQIRQIAIDTLLPAAELEYAVQYRNELADSLSYLTKDLARPEATDGA